MIKAIELYNLACRVRFANGTMKGFIAFKLLLAYPYIGTSNVKEFICWLVKFIIIFTSIFGKDVVKFLALISVLVSLNFPCNNFS